MIPATFRSHMSAAATAAPASPEAKRAGEQMERAMKRAGKTGEAFDLLSRMVRASDESFDVRSDCLIEEARELIATTGGVE